ncbi:MAG: transrane efflux protein [Actinomycetia bacterium]|nr:transrane efflux protein [Actinomycetes bacterium]
MSGPPEAAASPGLRLGSAQGRYVLAAAVLGSGIAFLDSTVVNVALPTIGNDLHADLHALQWVLDAYLITLTAFLLLGGSLGDTYGRKRIFVYGLVGFTVASVLCGIAPNVSALIVARALQGTAGALLVPGSLALISSSFAVEDRGAAVGAWSGLTGVTSAIGPFVGGWLIDAVSWRLIFLINVPLAIVAVLIATRHVAETRAPVARHIDVTGAVLISLALAGISFALIEQGSSSSALVATTAVVGVVSLVLFFVVEVRKPEPMLPLGLFRNAQFSGANATTLAVYGALGGAFFLIVLQLQRVLGYSAVEAGASLVPITVLMLLLSAKAGRLSQRIGPRVPMTIGPLIVAAGLVMFGRVGAGDHYFTTVLPAAIVFGLGLSTTVAPLTAAVLGAVDDARVGIASGVNNAVARLAGLLAVAVLPTLVGLDKARGDSAFSHAFTKAMNVSAVLAVVGGIVAFMTIRTGRVIEPTTAADISQPCHDPSRVVSAATSR